MKNLKQTPKKSSEMSNEDWMNWQQAVLKDETRELDTERIVMNQKRYLRRLKTSTLNYNRKGGVSNA